MAMQNSYEFQNDIRQLDEQFDLLRQTMPMFISLIPVGPAISNTKLEWLEEQLSPTSTAITALATDGDGTTFDVGSTSGFKAGDIVGFRSSTGASKTEVAKVASITDSNTLVLTRDYGGSTGVTLTTGDVIFLISRPLAESTDPTAYDGSEGSVNYNYTQIEDYVAKISKTAQLVKQYGVENALNAQVERGMVHLLRRMNNAVIYNRRVERSASENGTLGGALQFLEGGNVKNVAGALTKDVLNDVLEMIFSDGVVSNNIALVMSENQARRVSKFNTATSNQVVQVPAGSTETGGYINAFIGDLPVQGGWRSRIVVEPNFPKDQVAVIDLNRVSLRYLRPLTDVDATPNGADYWQRRMLTEFTLQVRDGQKAHGLLTGLTI